MGGSGIARLDKILTYVSNFTLRVLACAKISKLPVVRFALGGNLVELTSRVLNISLFPVIKQKRHRDWVFLFAGSEIR